MSTYMLNVHYKQQFSQRYNNFKIIFVKIENDFFVLF